MLSSGIWICLLLLLLATAVSKMAKIKTYPDGAPLDGAEKLVGTDVNDGNATKNFTVQDVADFATDPANTNVVNSVTGANGVSATPTEGDVTVGLTNTGVTAGTYTHATVVVDEQGRVTSAANGSLSAGVDSLNGLQGNVQILAGTDINVTTGPTGITIDSTAGGGGSVTSITAGTGLDGGTITTTGTIDMADTAVTPGTYTAATITVDQQGRITSASNSGATADQGLQSVLDTDDTAVDSNIVLTGTSAVSVPTGTLIVQTANLTGLATINQAVIQDYIQIQHELQDSSGATGTLGQILISDPTYNAGAGGVLWTDQPVLSKRVSLSAVDLNSLTTTVGIELIASPGIGNAIQVIGAAFSYDFNSAQYQFTNDLGLYCGLPGLAVNPQYTLPATVINSFADIAANMDSATQGRLLPNQPLEIYTTAGTTTTTGDGTVNMEITYKIVSL